MDVRRMDFSKDFVPTMILRKVPSKHLYTWKEAQALLERLVWFVLSLQVGFQLWKSLRGFEIHLIFFKLLYFQPSKP
jgi:hypothetical protein